MKEPTFTKNSFNLYLLMLHNPNLTLEEMCKRLNFKSLTSVQRALCSLEKNNLATRDKYQQRSWKAINIDWFNCPFCHRVIDLETHQQQ